MVNVIESVGAVFIFRPGKPVTVVYRKTGKVTRKLTPHYRRILGALKGLDRPVVAYDYTEGYKLGVPTFEAVVRYYRAIGNQWGDEGAVNGADYGFSGHTVFFQ
jgi:hypothetical protein